jgi:hypothetical protein
MTGSFRTIDDVEYATMEWVDWYNNRRLPSHESFDRAFGVKDRTRRYLVADLCHFE